MTNERSEKWVRGAAVLAFLGVALGAIGAHALKARLGANDSIDTWKTAALYHLIHSLALFVVAAVCYRKSVCVCFGLGVVLFSGSLYALALTGWKVLGPVTPIGGVLFLVGWAILACTAGRRDQSA